MHVLIVRETSCYRGLCVLRCVGEWGTGIG